MKRSTATWTCAVSAAALLALPASALAQTPPSQPPAAQATPPATPPSTAPNQAAQEHLRQAREALDQVKTTSVDAKARTQLAEIKKHISNLERAGGANDSASATAQANRNTRSTASRGNVNWGTEVAAIDKSLTSLLGPETTTGAAAASGTAGTSGKSATAITLDDATRAQLMEVRKHITAYAAAMAGGTPEPAAETPATSASAATSDPAAAAATSGSAAAATTPPATAQPPATPPTAAAQAPQLDEQQARRHLTEARNTLSALTQLPAAAQLNGDARTQVSQLITNFNELITTQSEWRAAYGKVSANLTALIGAEESTASTGTTGSGTTGAVGTSGTASAPLDPAVREKLMELRRHLAAFEKAAGGGSGDTPPETAATAAPPAAAASATGTTGATGAGSTSGTTGSASSAAGTPPQAPPPQASSTDLATHMAAIDALLKMQDESGGLTLTKAQVEQLRTHWTAIRAMLERK